MLSLKSNIAHSFSTFLLALSHGNHSHLFCLIICIMLVARNISEIYQTHRAPRLESNPEKAICSGTRKARCFQWFFFFVKKIPTTFD